jgi:hypothetical protein
MMNKTGTAAARVLSEMYRERGAGKEPRPLTSSRELPPQGKNDGANPGASYELGEGGGPEY